MTVGFEDMLGLGRDESDMHSAIDTHARTDTRTPLQHDSDIAAIARLEQERTKYHCDVM